MIPVLRPSFGEAEEKAVAEVLRSGWVGLGPKVEEFEHKFAASLGVKYAVATSSCTTALQIALQISDVGEGGYVPVPSLTFVSSAHAIRYCGAQPVFMDTDPTSLCSLNEQCEEVLERRFYGAIDAIVSVLYAGQPIGITSDKYPVIYDCAHAAGSSWDARGKLCCWSFHAVKNLSCGEGGMITTDDEQLARRARSLRWMGISTSTYERNRPASTYKWEYDCREIGYKANMSDIQAAIGLVQLERLPEMQAKRIDLYNEYINLLPIVVKPLLHEPRSSLHLMVVKCERRDELHKFLAERGVSTGVHYKPIHLYPCYGYQTPLPVVESEWQKLLTLPLFVDLTIEQVHDICGMVGEFYARG